MAKSKDKKTDPKAMTEEHKRVASVNDKINAITDGRDRWEYKWYENISFDDGRHFTYYNRSRNVIENLPARKGAVARVNHIAHRKMKDLQNTILMNDPRWKALPKPDDNGIIDQSASEVALKKNHYLKNLFDEKNIKSKQAHLVYTALIMPYSGAWWVWDDIENEVDADVYDAFDIIIPGDVLATEVQSSPMVGKRFSRTINELQSNEMYEHTEDLEPDNRYSGSDIKDQRFKEKFNAGEKKLPSESKICTELWQRLFLTDEIREKIIELDIAKGRYKKEMIDQPPTPILDEFGEPLLDEESGEVVMQENPPLPSKHWCEEKPNGYKVMYITMTTKDCEYFHREEYADFPLYPCAIYAPETGNLLKPAWIERVMSSNKSLDVLQSRIEDYANLAGGRLLKKAGTETSRYETSVGTEIEWEGDTKPEWEQAPNLPDSVPQAIGALKSDIAEMTVMGGNVAQVAHNGRGQGAMESIKSSDMASVKTAIDNLANFMEQSASIIMALNHYNLNKVKMVYQENGIGSSQEDRYFKVIGGQAAQEPRIQDAYKSAAPEDKPIPLDMDTKVKVVIDSGMAYTEQAKRDTMFQLAQMGYLPAEVVLESMKFDNVSDMMSTLRAQQNPSMIDTPDFNALDPDAKLAALQNAQERNINLPVNPTKIGTAKKIAKGLNGSAKNS